MSKPRLNYVVLVKKNDVRRIYSKGTHLSCVAQDVVFPTNTRNSPFTFYLVLEVRFLGACWISSVFGSSSPYQIHTRGCIEKGILSLEDGRRNSPGRGFTRISSRLFVLTPLCTAHLGDTVFQIYHELPNGVSLV